MKKLLFVLLSLLFVFSMQSDAQNYPPRTFVMQPTGWFAPYKDPLAVLDYTIDWTQWLSTDTISTSSWTCDTGITIQASSNTTTGATVWLAGGTNGTTYRVTNTIRTAGGRTRIQSFFVPVSNR